MDNHPSPDARTSHLRTLSKISGAGLSAFPVSPQRRSVRVSRPSYRGLHCCQHPVTNFFPLPLQAEAVCRRAANHTRVAITVNTRLNRFPPHRDGKPPRQGRASSPTNPRLGSLDVLTDYRHRAHGAWLPDNPTAHGVRACAATPFFRFLLA